MTKKKDTKTTAAAKKRAAAAKRAAAKKKKDEGKKASHSAQVGKNNKGTVVNVTQRVTNPNGKNQAPVAAPAGSVVVSGGGPGGYGGGGGGGGWAPPRGPEGYGTGARYHPALWYGNGGYGSAAPTSTAAAGYWNGVGPGRALGEGSARLLEASTGRYANSVGAPSPAVYGPPPVSYVGGEPIGTISELSSPVQSRSVSPSRSFAAAASGAGAGAGAASRDPRSQLTNPFSQGSFGLRGLLETNEPPVATENIAEAHTPSVKSEMAEKGVTRLRAIHEEIIASNTPTPKTTPQVTPQVTPISRGRRDQQEAPPRPPPPPPRNTPEPTPPPPPPPRRPPPPPQRPTPPDAIAEATAFLETQAGLSEYMIPQPQMGIADAMNVAPAPVQPQATVAAAQMPPPPPPPLQSMLVQETTRTPPAFLSMIAGASANLRPVVAATPVPAATSQIQSAISARRAAVGNEDDSGTEASEASGFGADQPPPQEVSAAPQGGARAGPPGAVGGQLGAISNAMEQRQAEVNRATRRVNLGRAPSGERIQCPYCAPKAERTSHLRRGEGKYIPPKNGGVYTNRSAAVDHAILHHLDDVIDGELGIPPVVEFVNRLQAAGNLPPATHEELVERRNNPRAFREGRALGGGRRAPEARDDATDSDGGRDDWD